MNLGKRERGVLPPAHVARAVQQSRRKRDLRATARILGIAPCSVERLASQVLARLGMRRIA